MSSMAADESAKKAIKEDMQKPMHSTFDERLKRKMSGNDAESKPAAVDVESGRSGGLDDAPRSTFDERLKRKMSGNDTESKPAAVDVDSGRRGSPKEANEDESEGSTKKETPENNALGQEHSGEVGDSSIQIEDVESPSEDARVRNSDADNAIASIDMLSANVRASSVVLLNATLVEEETEPDVVVAEPLTLQKRWKALSVLSCFFLISLAVLISLLMTLGKDKSGVISDAPSSAPSSAPSFDTRSTLEIVRERGRVRCGGMEDNDGPFRELCRSVAAVIVGDPEAFEMVPVTALNRFQILKDRAVDLVVFGDTHTVEREVQEITTGTGFSFSSVYNYDGMVYVGNETFVDCAEGQKRYDTCASLVICAEEHSTHYEFVKRAFPLGYYKAGSSTDEILEMLFNDTCNVMARDKSTIPGSLDLIKGTEGRNFTVGTKMMTKEPLAIVTRNNDQEFSDIVNWVVLALVYGEEQGLIKNATLCQNHTDFPSHEMHDLNFLNAVYCVGNYKEIFYSDTDIDRGMNKINNGTGMLYATPFGKLNMDKNNDIGPSRTLTKIKKEKKLKCGVVVPDDFEGNLSESDKLVGMSIDYCHALAAAIFIGDFKKVDFFKFSGSDDSFLDALANESIDVLVGGRINRKHDFEGLHFSTPYYFGKESASHELNAYSIATREDDVLFRSLVNCIVLATIYAQESGIHKETNLDMPLVPVFGTGLDWALRDAIAHIGSYDELYLKHFNDTEEMRGRNTLNEGGPILLSFLDLHQQYTVFPILEPETKNDDLAQAM